MNKPIVIAGAGIIGVSIAYHLAKAGAHVVIIDKGEPGQGATADSFAWINASRGKTPYYYYMLNRLGIGAWHQLDLELDGTLGVVWGGSVEWGQDSAETQTILTETHQHQQNGYPLQQIDMATLTQLEPNVETGSADVAVYTPIEGHIDPVAATHVLLAKACELGVELKTACEVVGLTMAHGRLQAVETTQGIIETESPVATVHPKLPHLQACLCRYKILPVCWRTPSRYLRLSSVLFCLRMVT